MLDIQTDDLQDPTYSIGQAMVASVVCPGEKKNEVPSRKHCRDASCVLVQFLYSSQRFTQNGS